MLRVHRACRVDHQRVHRSLLPDRSHVLSMHSDAAAYGLSLFRLGHNAPFDLSNITHIDRAQFHPKEWRYGLDGGELADSCRHRGVAKYGHSRHMRGRSV